MRPRQRYRCVDQSHWECMTAMSVKVVVLLALSISMTGCIKDMLCHEEITSETKSPDSERVAETVTRDCGATTSWTTSVRVRWTNSRPEPRDMVFAAVGLPEVQVSWLDETTLSVDCRNCTEDQIYQRATKSGKVKILFNEITNRNE
jgi:hypothetical protein